MIWPDVGLKKRVPTCKQTFLTFAQLPPVKVQNCAKNLHVTFHNNTLSDYISSQYTIRKAKEETRFSNQIFNQTAGENREENIKTTENKGKLQNNGKH